MTHPSAAQVQPTQRRLSYLRRELLWAIALKLVLLFSLKAAFFPQRLPAPEAASGVADRIALPSPPAPSISSKDQP
ncbi:cytochrome oxidase putative small subunit CydP [Rhodoferax sp. U11-2br]|uniref:cytochrome oxidase putative small subunit CydP n=1 Tax=Rhodoferax sp. U11-2br TaxID=2838878 RepID=UPI001BEBC59C|nr:cytochrome oxidase putative small subunit CydP [Rhodoferax sp. U11-2br]MBT3066309.1 hypothetical protein [Rhodoferax sp. U11-2br]